MRVNRSKKSVSFCSPQLLQKYVVFFSIYESYIYVYFIIHISPSLIYIYICVHVHVLNI